MLDPEYLRLCFEVDHQLDAWRLLRRVSTRLSDLAVLHRGRAGDADGSDNLAIRYEGNAAFERRGSAQRERAQPEATLRHQVLEHLAWPPVVKRAARFILATAIEPYCVLSNLCNVTIWPVLSRMAIAMPQLFFTASTSATAITFFAASSPMGGP